jgi:hypothetical protein
MLRALNPTLPTDLIKLREELMKMPLSLVKKAVLNAVFDYQMSVINKRGLLRLMFTNLIDRGQDIIFISEQVKLSDDAFIRAMRAHFSQLEPTSELRKNIFIALNKSELELERRRKAVELWVAVVGALLFIQNPNKVMGLIGLVSFLAYLGGYLSSGVKEVLEMIDTTDFISGTTSYHRALN